MAGLLQHFTTVAGHPYSDTQSVMLTIAMRIVRNYGDRIPSAAELQKTYGVSRATSYRWRNAFIQSLAS